MKTMLFGVTALSVLGGAVLCVFPKNSRVVPYLRFLLSLILLVMLLSPLTALLSEVQLSDPGTWLIADREAAAGSSYWQHAVADGAAERAEAALEALICADVGVAAEEMDVALTTETTYGTEETTVTVTAVTVTLYRRAHWIAADKIAALVERTMLCPCTVMQAEEEDA